MLCDGDEGRWYVDHVRIFHATNAAIAITNNAMLPGSGIGVPDGGTLIPTGISGSTRGGPVSITWGSGAKSAALPAGSVKNPAGISIAVVGGGAGIVA